MDKDNSTKQVPFLEEIVVLDLTDEPGVFCSALLAGLGARVTRIEWRSSYSKARTDSVVYRYHNACKKILLLDSDDPSDVDTFNGLLKNSDVLVDTRLQKDDAIPDLSLSLLARLNPRLIHVSLTGFGQTGPRRSYRWTNKVVSAFAGQTFVTGAASDRPRPLGGNQSYNAASLYGAVAAVMALHERHSSGKSRFIDVSAQEALASTLDHVMVDYFAEGKVCRRQGQIYGENAFVILPCSDGFVQISILQNWDTLVELMASEGKAGSLANPIWQKNEYRESHFDELVEVVTAWSRAHSKDELFELSQAMRFPWAPVATLQDVTKNPQLVVRGFFPADDKLHPAQPLTPYRITFPDDVAQRKIPTTSARPCSSGAVLSGVRVVDFTWMLAGPYATRILADFGAQVIKIQSRRTAKGAEDNETPYFASWNRNKSSVTLDMTHPEARRLIEQLIAKSDVVVENFAPRVMAEWGLSYERIREIKPDIIMASLSSMGQEGPWREYVGFGPTFHALSGLVAATSECLSVPICPGHAYGDSTIGLYGALSVLSALHWRKCTGLGAFIDLSGYEAVCSLLGPEFMNKSIECTGTAQKPDRAASFPSGSFPCKGKDRWCVIDIESEEEWRVFCAIEGLKQLRQVEFSTPSGRYIHKDSLTDIIAEWTSKHGAEDLVRRLQELGIAAGVVQNAKDIASDAHLADRGFFIALDHPVLQKTVGDRTPLMVGRDEPKQWRPAPLLGADNLRVFSDVLGLSPAEIDDYIRKEVIG
jgi:crotonobetainyl-CoA:carnitine CoA-transferase CaiB-like acyl-CoA transferase